MNALRIAESAARAFRSVATALGRPRSNRRAVRELSALGDHLLRDLGIERHEIEGLTHGVPPRVIARQARPAAAPPEPTSAVTSEEPTDTAAGGDWSAATQPSFRGSV